MKLDHFLLTGMGLLLAGSLFTGCSGCNQGASDTSASPASTTTTSDGSGADATGADASGHDHDHSADGHEGHGHDDAGHGTAEGVDPWTRTYETPEAERTGTVENLQGLRATLVAELDQVRERLKDGTRSAEDRKADTQRAAELAQGLERLDRTIKEISEASDVTWADVRESQIKAAGEFREWMAKYGLAS